MKKLSQILYNGKNSMPNKVKMPQSAEPDASHASDRMAMQKDLWLGNLPYTNS